MAKAYKKYKTVISRESDIILDTESHELHRFMYPEAIIDEYSWLTICSIAGTGIEYLSNLVQADFGVHVSLFRNTEVLISRLVVYKTTILGKIIYLDIGLIHASLYSIPRTCVMRVPM